MTWGPCLHEEIVHLFWEAQHPQRVRVAIWFERRHHHRLARRRDSYDTHRYFHDDWYIKQLERAKKRSRLRVECRAASYVAIEARKAAHNAAGRVARVSGRLCPECGSPVRVGHMGPTPKYCSTACNHRAAGRAYWHRHREKILAAYRERCLANPEKERTRKRESWRKHHGRRW